MIREFMDYIDDIAVEIEHVKEFTDGMTYEQFVADTKTSYAIVRALEVIGEASKSVPAETKIKYHDVPWKEMAGMRDKLAHGYFGVDWDVVWEVAKTHIPRLKPLIMQIIIDNSDV